VSGSSRTQTSRGQQIVQRSPWKVSTLRNQVPKPKFGPEKTEKAGDKEIVLREVQFEAETGAGSPLNLYGVFATPARPAADKRRLPALLLLAERAASEEQAQAWAARGYAALTLELPGKGKDREKVRSTGPDWTEDALASPSPTANPLHASVAAVITTVNLLAAQPEVDPKRIGMLGEGWSGVVAALAGAVDDRPNALVLARTSGGLAQGPLAEPLKKLAPKDREAWTKSYDPDSYARADHPPTLFVQPLAAEQPSVASVTASYKARTGTKTLALIPADAKDGESDTITTWLATRMLGEAPLPEIRSLRPDGDAAVVTTAGKQIPRSVAVYYAAGDPSKTEWKSVTGEKTGDGTWRCALPKPEEGKPLTVFAALTDARGAILCTEPGPLTLAAGPKGKAVAARSPQ
jgi:hypothetical protein